MTQDSSSPPVFMSTIWFLLGLIIFIGNTLTMVLMWRTKKNRERKEIRLIIHVMWNVEGSIVAFAVVGLTLATTLIIRLSTTGDISSSWRTCNSFGFFMAFFFHFAAMSILVVLMNHVFALLKPFMYHSYNRGKSILPFVGLGCCMLFGLINAILPLINMGDYSQKTIYSTCLLTWDTQLAVRLIALLNIILEMIIFGFLLINFQQWIKLLRNRTQMKVPRIRPKESIVFSLVSSSLFFICWLPYLIVMLVSTYHKDVVIGDKGKASLFGITLIPLILNPVVSYCLHGHFREEFLSSWQHLKTSLLKRILHKNEEQTPAVNSIIANKETTEM